jgi:hypothetical protein
MLIIEMRLSDAVIASNPHAAWQPEVDRPPDGLTVRYCTKEPANRQQMEKL